jgi:hypothetical protein
MKARFAFFLDPEPGGDQLVQLAQDLQADGYSLHYMDISLLVRLEMKPILLEKGATAVLSFGPINEEVLPDNTPRDCIADTLRYKLNRCAPTSTLMLIDPYIFPSQPDPGYESYFLKIFADTIKACSALTIVTLPSRNVALEIRLNAMIQSIAPKIIIDSKYSMVFHDRFWIADDSRGLFVGTSLTGIGRRYAVIDYLNEEDTQEIVQRARAIP